jgi:hypothetical protein
VGKRLEDLDSSVEELAEAVHVPVAYLEDLIAGRRRPPLPERTDLYGPMTSYLKLDRNELAECATAERANAVPAKTGPPTPDVLRLLMALSEPETAKRLERRRAKNGDAEVIGFVERLLAQTQAAVLRVLADRVTLRVAAERAGSTFAAARLEVLEFLDTTPETLTVDHTERFIKPRIAQWGADLETGVLRIVMRGQDVPGGHRRRPTSRNGF